MGHLVYRVENSEGKGPYNNPSLYDFSLSVPIWSTRNHNDDLIHPSPNRDSKLKEVWREIFESGERRSWFFGFESMEQLKNWFTDYELGRLESLGYLVKTYYVTELHFGEKQVIFKKGVVYEKAA